MTMREFRCSPGGTIAFPEKFHNRRNHVAGAPAGNGNAVPLVAVGFEEGHPASHANVVGIAEGDSVNFLNQTVQRAIGQHDLRSFAKFDDAWVEVVPDVLEVFLKEGHGRSLQALEKLLRDPGTGILGKSEPVVLLRPVIPGKIIRVGGDHRAPERGCGFRSDRRGGLISYGIQ
jgi:hypothetical protein